MNATATTILEQLGGNRFAAMTGAKLIAREDGLNICLPRAAKDGCNIVHVTVDAGDLYMVTFRKFNVTFDKLLATKYDVPCCNLREVFEEGTGLRCTL